VAVVEDGLGGEVEGRNSLIKVQYGLVGNMERLLLRAGGWLLNRRVGSKRCRRLDWLLTLTLTVRRWGLERVVSRRGSGTGLLGRLLGASARLLGLLG